MNESTGKLQHRRSLWIAALLTCFVTPLSWWLWFFVLGLVQEGRVSSSHLSDLLFLGYIIGPLSAAAMALVGLPLTFWMRARGMLNAGYVCAAALLTGAAVGGLVSPHATQQRFLIIGAATGLAAGVIFSLLAGIRLRATSVRH